MATAANNRNKWKADKTIEATKLASAQSGWNLATGTMQTRTRHGGNGRPDLMAAAQRLSFHHGSDTDSSFFLDEEEDAAAADDGGDDDESVDESLSSFSEEKPMTKRAILEVESLSKLFENHCACPICKKPLTLLIDSICLASSMTAVCSTRGCGYVAHGDPPAKANIQVRNFPFDRRERTTDYAINIIYALGIISVGDGCVEAGRFVGLLSLPRDTSMERRSFPTIEERIGPAMRDLQEEILDENLTEEVQRVNAQSALQDENDFMLWQQSVDPSSSTATQFDLHKNKYPVIQASFDMGWQQKGSGHIYNSASGHSIFVGAETRKAIGLEIKSKKCNFCDEARKKLKDAQGPIVKHECCSNYVGSSGGMEPQACLDLMTRMYDNKKVLICKICCDDDASTRSMLQWSNADHMKNNNTTTVPMVPITKGKNTGKLQPRIDKGMLPGHIPEPTFVADPNHRRKVLTGELYKLLTLKVKDRLTMSRMDVNRIGKNFGYMIKALPMMDESTYEAAGKAVLEHHFDNHEFCGPWCRRKDLTAAEKKASKRFYRNKEDPIDAKLYARLHEIISRFVTLDRLREVAHGMDTQVNESFNNTVSWFAPKNKVYCGTRSLANRIAMAVGINSIGFVAFFTRLYAKLGIQMDASVLYFLKQKDTYRYARLASLKKTSKKKLRMKRKFDRLKEDEMVARVQRQKRAGTYRRGMNLDEEDGGAYDTTSNKKNKARKDLVCPYCHLVGHSTTRSKKCLQNPTRLLAPQQNEVQHGEESEPEEAQDNEDLDLFYDVGTWSDEEEQGLMSCIL